MEILLLVLALTLTACLPGVPPPDGSLDAQTDSAVAPDASEASADVLPPHVDGGGID